MNFRHSGAVIVSKFSEKRSTLFADMMTSCGDAFRMSVSVSPIMPESMTSAKQITTFSEPRRGQGCDICARDLWQARNFNRWWVGFDSAAKCRKPLWDEKTFELRKGDLSIRKNSSRDGVLLASTSTTYCELEGQF
jgi:hypothetical protein